MIERSERDLFTPLKAMIEQKKARVGIIGLGYVGLPLARAFTDHFHRRDEPDAIIICVPTPLTETREPDLTYIVNSAQAIAERLRPGQLVVLESTTYPGTTRRVVQPILEARGLRAGKDFFLG